MGRPMASNLMGAGYDLVLHNRTKEKADRLAAEGGGEVAENPREVAEKCDVVITMVPGANRGRGGCLRRRWAPRGDRKRFPRDRHEHQLADAGEVGPNGTGA